MELDLGIQPELASGQLITEFDEYMPDSYDSMAAYPPQPHLPAHICFFIDMLRKVYTQPDYWALATSS